MHPSILPAELWDSIFSECKNTPLCLSQICSHLRTTVHTNSKLWSVIKINVYYKRGSRGGLQDNAAYIAHAQADGIAQFLHLSGTHPITLIFVPSVFMITGVDWPADFDRAARSHVFPLVRCALGRCREVKIGAKFAGQKFNDVISDLLRGMALPMLRDVSFHGSEWDVSYALERLLAGAPNIQRIYLSSDVLDIPPAHLEWAHTIREFRLGRCWTTSPGHSIPEQFPNVSNLSIITDMTVDRRLQDPVGLRNVLSGLRRLTSLSLYMDYVSQKYVLEAFKLRDVDIPTLKELSIVYTETAVQYPIDESGFVRLIHRAASLLDLLQPVQPTLRVLIVSEPLATITPYCPLSPAFLGQMHDKSFLPMLTSLHLVWNHVVDEMSVVDMLEHRAFDEVSVGRGLPFEGMEEEVKRRVLQLNVAYPPVLREPYGTEI
ncbi:hypothetical protein BDZ89DRAFT_1073559 [Hymenopellis radicata]|nr:hypothetical protein BDZ89DRAFT_1073559 [Hymenopellis radicata]